MTEPMFPEREQQIRDYLEGCQGARLADIPEQFRRYERWLIESDERATVLLAELDRLRSESEQRLGELLFWHFEFREAMDNYLGEAHEVKRLRSELARERRERDEAVERAQERMEKAIAATLARKKAEAKVHAIAQVRVWKNEDGKGFLFADDVRAALDLAVPAAGEATR
jgi:hypothetical protein